jgi:signal peptidase I
MIFGIIITYYLYPLQPYRIGVIDTPSIYKKVVVYKKINNPSKVEKNRLYVFKLPVNTKYYKKGTLFIKYAKCLPGEKLEVKGFNFYCNGKFIAKAKPTDIKGVKVKHFEYNGTVPPNEVFMYAPHPRSFDSRYWGFVPFNKIIGEGIW